MPELSMRAMRFFLALLVAGPAAGECLLTVNSTADVPQGHEGDPVCETATGNGICTLRAAIMSANTRAASCRIVVPAGTYALTIPPGPLTNDPASGDYDVLSSMTVEGAGIDRTTIVADGVDRAFHVQPGAVFTLAGVTVSGGATSGPGGSIYAEGPVTISWSALQWGVAPIGGCIATVAELTILDSIVRDCSSTLGGGIYANLPSATLHVERSSITNNDAAYGGGILAAGGPVDLVNTTVARNTATGNGGGISSPSLRAFNCTIVGNGADSDRNGSGAGGGVASSPGTAALYDTVLTGNSVGAALGDCDGTVVSNGTSIVQTPSCTVLGFYYHAPMSWGHASTYYVPRLGSVALDGGNANGCVDALGAPLLVDQRGGTRPLGAHCDVGAIERGPSADINGDGVVDVLDVFYLINFLFAAGSPPRGWANANMDGTVDVSDVFYLINSLFAGGPPPADLP